MTRDSKYNTEGWIWKENGNGRRHAEMKFRFWAYSLENSDLWAAGKNFHAHPTAAGDSDGPAGAGLCGPGCASLRRLRPRL